MCGGGAWRAERAWCGWGLECVGVVVSVCVVCGLRLGVGEGVRVEVGVWCGTFVVEGGGVGWGGVGWGGVGGVVWRGGMVLGRMCGMCGWVVYVGVAVQGVEGVCVGWVFAWG